MAQLKGDIPPVLPSPGKQNGNFRNDLINVNLKIQIFFFPQTKA